MELLFILVLLLAIDIAALRWGADSRDDFSIDVRRVV
jgi:hypothetical protein